MADPVEPARAGDTQQQPARRRIPLTPVRTPYDGPHYSHEALDALMREPPGRGRDSD